MQRQVICRWQVASGRSTFAGSSCPRQVDAIYGVSGRFSVLLLTLISSSCYYSVLYPYLPIFGKDGESVVCVSNWGNHCQPAGFVNPAPEQSSPGRINNPLGKKEKRPKLNRTRDRSLTAGPQRLI